MSTRKLHFLPAVLCAFLVSCQDAKDMPATNQDESGGAPELVDVTFSAVGESTDGKSAIQGRTPVWEMTDKLSVFGPAGINSMFEAVSVDVTRAVFHGQSEASGPYCAVYPYSADNVYGTKGVSVEIPAVQKIAAGRTSDAAALVSVAHSSDRGSLVFRNVGALLKLKIESDGFTSLLLSSNDGRALAGRVTVNPQTGVIVSVDAGVSQIELLPDGETFAQGEYFISVLPGVSQNGITMTMRRATDARKAEKTGSTKMSLARNAMLNIGSFATNMFEWRYLIDSFADFKAYANDAYNWDEDGEIISLRVDIDMEMEAWTPITDQFGGVFDGGGHCLYNINLRSGSYQHLGVFGKYYKDVINLTFGSKDGKTYDGKSEIYNTYANGTGWTYTAPITFSDGTIRNVVNFMPVTVSKTCGNKSRTAGISAWTERDGVEIIDCVNYADVILGASPGEDANVNIAGILSGINSSNVKISGCVNYGKIRSSSIYTKGIGGIVGLNYTAAVTPVIENCTNYGEIIQQYTDTQNDFLCVGGIIGRATSKAENDPFVVRNCTNYGKVTGCGVHQQGIGGIVGRGDGVAVISCTNEGTVSIDHSKKATARWQALGGIIGIAMDGNGKNSADNCINKGNLVMTKVASCGRVSTTSTTAFYGVTAGGIIGCAALVSSLTGNVNYGSIDAVNEYTANDSATMRATVYAGGILGFDYAAITTFRDNRCNAGATIKARTTNSSAKNAEIRAGGVVGSLEHSTMASGTGCGVIDASNASTSGAKVYAGSVAGYNGATISLCYYAGTVNGAAASTKNIVGGGNAPAKSAPAGDVSTNEHDGNLGDLGAESGNWD